MKKIFFLFMILHLTFANARYGEDSENDCYEDCFNENEPNWTALLIIVGLIVAMMFSGLRAQKKAEKLALHDEIKYYQILIDRLEVWEKKIIDSGDDYLRKSHIDFVDYDIKEYFELGGTFELPETIKETRKKIAHFRQQQQELTVKLALL